MSLETRSLRRRYWLESILVLVVLCLLVQAVQFATVRPTIGVNLQKLYSEVSLFEGIKHKMYQDVNGTPHIGIGYNLTREDAPQRLKALGLDYESVLAGRSTMNDRQIRILFQWTLEDAAQDCRGLIPEFDALDDVRKRVLINMAFNLGAPRLGKFVKMLEAIKQHDFGRAADEMVDSKWYGQVGKRAEMLVQMMRSGQDPDLE